MHLHNHANITLINASDFDVCVYLRCFCETSASPRVLHVVKMTSVCLGSKYHNTQRNVLVVFQNVLL